MPRKHCLSLKKPPHPDSSDAVAFCNWLPCRAALEVSAPDVAIVETVDGVHAAGGAVRVETKPYCLGTMVVGVNVVRTHDQWRHPGRQFHACRKIFSRQGMIILL
jgi:hypothetical protein